MTAQVLVDRHGGPHPGRGRGLVAPRLFPEHLARTGEDSPAGPAARRGGVRVLLRDLLDRVAMVAALTAAGLVSWFLVRRVARPRRRSSPTPPTQSPRATTRSRCPPSGFGSELHPAVRARSTGWPTGWPPPTPPAPACSPTWPTSCAPRWPPSRPTSTAMEDHVVPSDAPRTRSCATRSPGCAGWPSTSRRQRQPRSTPSGWSSPRWTPATIARDAVAAARPAYQGKDVSLELTEPDRVSVRRRRRPADPAGPRQPPRQRAAAHASRRPGGGRDPEAGARR